MDNHTIALSFIAGVIANNNCFTAIRNFFLHRFCFLSNSTSSEGFPLCFDFIRADLSKQRKLRKQIWENGERRNKLAEEY